MRCLQLQGIPKKLLNHVLSVANREQSQISLPEDTTDAKLENSSHVHRPQMKATRTDDSPINENPAQNSRRTTCNGVNDKLRKLIKIISEESGIDGSQLSDETSFVTIGVDSLLSLIITSRLREELAFDIGPRSSIFDQFSTVGELKTELAKSEDLDTAEDFCTPCPVDGKRSSEAASGPVPSSRTMTHDEDKMMIARDRSTTTTLPLLEPHDTKPHHTHSARPCTSLMLQRSSHSSPHTLFLFPDGSGSPHSYVYIPPVHPHLSVIGLICPYRQDPPAMLTSSFNAVMESYLNELQRLSPHGPYSLGGWSSGGIFAFEAARRLTAVGEIVRHLVLIDSPAPTRGLQRLPSQFYEHAQAAGIFGQIGAGIAAAAEIGGGDVPSPLNKNPPGWLIPHFKATIELLRDHRPEPLMLLKGRGSDAESAGPRTSIYWAGKRVRFPGMPRSRGPDGNNDDGEDYGDDDGEGMRFLTDVKTDFSPGAWAELLPGWEIRVEVAAADHFGMMVGSEFFFLRVILLAFHLSLYLSL